MNNINFQNLAQNSLVELGKADLLTLGSPGTVLEGYGFPEPNRIDFN